MVWFLLLNHNLLFYSFLIIRQILLIHPKFQWVDIFNPIFQNGLIYLHPVFGIIFKSDPDHNFTKNWIEP